MKGKRTRETETEAREDERVMWNPAIDFWNPYWNEMDTEFASKGLWWLTHLQPCALWILPRYTVESTSKHLHPLNAPFLPFTHDDYMINIDWDVSFFTPSIHCFIEVLGILSALFLGIQVAHIANPHIHGYCRPQQTHLFLLLTKLSTPPGNRQGLLS